VHNSAEDSWRDRSGVCQDIAQLDVSVDVTRLVELVRRTAPAGA
jgi:hypothetical protein